LLASPTFFSLARQAMARPCTLADFVPTNLPRVRRGRDRLCQLRWMVIAVCQRVHCRLLVASEIGALADVLYHFRQIDRGAEDLLHLPFGLEHHVSVGRD